MSDRLAREIRSTLPAYDSSVREAEQKARLNREPVDPDVVVMQEMVVQDQRIATRKLEEGKREQEQLGRLKRKFLASMSGVGTALNSFAIPLIGGGQEAMAEAYARREMMRERIDGFQAVAETAKTVDSVAGEKLEKEIRALKHGSRPDGWPPVRP